LEIFSILNSNNFGYFGVKICQKFWHPKKEKLNAPILHSHFLTAHHYMYFVSRFFSFFLITFFKVFLAMEPLQEPSFQVAKKKLLMPKFRALCGFM
jgi:hypothetical protein